jgi:MFS transporter, DHA2 family, multidrug resistance protein
MVGTMAAFTSSTIVNVAVPELSRQFAVSQERVQWIAAAFMVAMLPALSVTPWLLQRYGMRRTYIGATLLLMAGGLIGGLSNDFYLLIAMRAAEGVASGVLQPIPNIVILRAFPAREQGRAMGIYGLGVVLAPATAPTLGGVLIEHFGWRAIFFVVVPFGLAALALSRSYLPVASSFIQEKKPLDWIGLAWISVATVCVLNGLSGLNRAGHVGPLLLLAIGIAGLVSFGFYQKGRADPLLQVRLFSHRWFVAAALVSFVYGFGIFGSTYMLPVFLQLALGYSPSQAGLVLLPAGLVLAFSMPIGGRLADRVQARVLVIAGALMLALSLILLAVVSASTPYSAILAWAILGRIGLAIVYPALSLASVRGLGAAEVMHAMSINNFARQLGGAMGISATGILLDWRLGARGIEDITAQSPQLQVLSAFSETFFTLAAVCCLAAIAAWFMRPRAAARGARSGP